MGLDLLSGKIINCAMKVHSTIGAGLYEEVYKQCLAHELAESGIYVKSEVDIPVIYNGKKLNTSYRVDLILEDKILVELKAVETIMPIHKVQLLTYLRLSNKKLGLLINFNTVLLKDGITRVIN